MLNSLKRERLQAFAYLGAIFFCPFPDNFVPYGAMHTP